MRSIGIYIYIGKPIQRGGEGFPGRDGPRSREGACTKSSELSVSDLPLPHGLDPSEDHLI